MSIAASEESVERGGQPAAVAAARKHSDHAWIIQVTALCVVLGLLLALAIRTTENMRKGGVPIVRHGVSAAVVSRWQERNEMLSREIEQLRLQSADFRENRKDEASANELLRKQIRDYRALTGFGPVQGPGLKITLRHSPLPPQPGTEDADYWVTDVDVNGLTSELWAAYAEAIALSGAGGPPERYIVKTTVRGEGQTMVIHGRALTAPFQILAIGNPKELRAALEMPEGIIHARGLNVLQMIEIEEAQNLVLPAYSPGGAADDAPAADQ
jgi:uncharacterized protein YlxW (UPF0749 family)